MTLFNLFYFTIFSIVSFFYWVINFVVNFVLSALLRCVKQLWDLFDEMKSVLLSYLRSTFFFKIRSYTSRCFVNFRISLKFLCSICCCCCCCCCCCSCDVVVVMFWLLLYLLWWCCYCCCLWYCRFLSYSCSCRYWYCSCGKEDNNHSSKFKKKAFSTLHNIRYGLAFWHVGKLLKI